LRIHAFYGKQARHIAVQAVYEAAQVMNPAADLINAAIGELIRNRYPHLFRHQIITFLTRKGIISPKLQLLSGHAEEKSLAIYRDLALADVSPEYQEAMRAFPVR